MIASFKTLKKDRLPPFLEGLLAEHDLFAPRRKEDRVVFEKIDSPGDVVLEHGNTKESPKFALFPQRETLFVYQADRGKLEVDVPPREGKGRILFGVRPCDVRGLLLLDKVFGGACSDPYYTEKREGMLVMSLGCLKPNPTCFCRSTGGGPCSPEGSDLFFLDLGDRFLVEAVTDKGAALLKAPDFEEADEASVALSMKIKEASEASMEPLELKESLTERLNQRFDDPAWKELAETCLGCGICTYLCPTCHCFDLCDEGTGQGGERIRVWDSCQFPLFTQQASGFNPRPTVKERFRQRIMHKFSYLPESQGMLGCVGCGRCITECPVNLDIRDVVTSLREGNAQ